MQTLQGMLGSMTKPTRREFVAMAALAGIGSYAGAQAGPKQSVIDPHFHIWDLARFRLPWLDGAGPVLNQSFTLDEYRAAIAGLGVEKSVYVEGSVKPEQREEEARFASGLCDGNGKPTSAVVVGGAPGTEGFEAYIRRLAASRAVHGVRASVA